MHEVSLISAARSFWPLFDHARGACFHTRRDRRPKTALHDMFYIVRSTLPLTS